MSSENCKRFLFTWSIENFSHSYYVNGQKLSSPSFVAESAGGSRWCLEIYPKGFDQENGDFVSCFLIRSDDNLFQELSEEIVIDFSLDAIGGNGESLGSFQEKNKIFKKGDSFGCLKLVKLEDLKNKIQSWHEDILTVCCSLVSYKPIAIEYVARTKIPIHSCSFDWKVLVNSPNAQNYTFYVASRKFQISAILKNSDFSVKICEVGKELDDSYHATCDITLLDMNGVAKLRKQYNYLFCRPAHADSLEFLFLTKEQLSDRKYILNSEKGLALACKFCISSNTNFNEIVKCQSDPSLSITTLQLQKDLRTLLLNEKHADVKLRTNDHLISAHRSILATRSPVFSAMFEQEMIESETGIIEVPDADPETLKIFLEFLYTGTMKEFEYDSAVKLLIIADKYEVSSLYKLCSSYLKSQLTVENVCEIIPLADMINHKCLKTSAMNYLANHAAEIMGSPDWDEWLKKNHTLSAEIISNIIANFSIVPKKVSGS